MTLKWYDRQGRIIDELCACQLSQDMDYKIVEQTVLPDGKFVSTVWLGLDHNFGEGLPKIFESMIFSSKGNFSDLDCCRYSTEEEAIFGHFRMVKKWS